MNEYVNDIPQGLARGAFGGVSMNPERRGDSARQEYADELAGDYEHFKEQATKGGTLDLLDTEFARYRSGMRQRYTAWLGSESRCISSFITGPSNFPVRRAEKRNEIAHKRLDEYFGFKARARRAVLRALRPDLRPIMAGDADAVDRLAEQLAKAERLQARMKAANAAIRKHKKGGEAAQVAALRELTISEGMARELLKPDFCGRIGFADYQLTNNGANIRRIKARMEQIERTQAQPLQQFEGIAASYEDDPPANRVRLTFPGKPAEAVRTELKRNGFRWTPSQGVWQAYRNYNSLAVARRIAGVPVGQGAT